MSGATPTEAEDDDEFYESLDRILSSSCSSTSASDDDADPHRRRRPRLRFPPPSAASLDVWLSEPASVEERRRRFLIQMGLAGDPVLSRRRDMSRSDSDPPSPYPNPNPNPDFHPHPAVSRSRSDCSPGPIAPLDKTLSRADTDDRSRFTIKNLDTGGEFIVKEFREFREVGTGRELTMEEFEMCVGRSPIVQELMRRQRNAEELNNGGETGASAHTRPKKRGGWLRSIKNAVAQRDRRSSDERDTSSEKGGRRSSSATDDSQDGPSGGGSSGPQRTRVRQYGKSQKELSCLFMSQEIHAHNGSIWSIKFSFDGRYLASAGEDCVIHVWQVQKQERKGELLAERVSEDGSNHHPYASQNGSPEPASGLACVEGGHWEKKRRAKVAGGKKSGISDQVLVPEHLLALSDKPVCTFRGHLEDVLDLSWSKSQYLLSSSMDKTVRLWHMSSNTCLRTFSHSDYVTCIQFNPVDDRFFISGSLDEKVRIWSIPHRQVVDWNDLHEMVTAACYTPDGQGALVGSHKGNCHFYKTSENKLHQQSQIALQNKRRKSSSKKITAFQFAPGSSSEVLITSADSRVRVIDGEELVHKFKGFRNRSSQISASLTANGKYVICASEDSHVYVWRYDADSQPGRRKGSVTVTQSYEHFHCQDVTVALPWPGTSMRGMLGTHISERKHDWLDGLRNSDAPVPSGISGHATNDYEDHAIILEPNASNYSSDRTPATLLGEKLLRTLGQRNSSDLCNGGFQVQIRSAWGLVIVTASRGGEIKTFQNFGVPVRI